MPGRAVEPRLVAGVNVFARAASPALATRDQLEFNYALGAESHSDFAIEILFRRGHENSAAPLERGQHLGPAHDLGKMWRTDLFLAFGHQHQIHRELTSCATNGMECREKGGFRALLIDRAPADDYFSQAGLFHHRRIPGWRG